MKTLRASAAALLCVVLPVSNIPAQHAEQDVRVVVMPEGETMLEWFARDGRTYFIQSSDPNGHLENWVWSPYIEHGNDEPISFEVGSTADKAFFRLHYTDAQPPPGVTLDDWDADGDGLPNALELQLQTHPLNPDTSGDGLPDGWAYVHGLHPRDFNADGLFQGGPATNLEAFQQGVQAHPDATLDDLDGDGVPNWEDAAPWDSLIDWKAPGFERFVVIEMPTQLLSAAGQTDPRVIGIDSEGNVLLATRNVSSNAQEGGFWKVGANAYEPAAAVSVTYDDPKWGNLTRSSVGLSGMAGDALVHYANAPVDYNFGGALVAAPGEAAYGFWPAFRAIGGVAYDVWPLGGDIHGTTYCYASNDGENGDYGFPSSLYLLNRPAGGDPAVTQAASFSDFENAGQHSLLAVTRQGWVAFYDKILHPSDAVTLVSPGTNMNGGWLQDLPERSKASAAAALRATAPSAGILVPDENGAWRSPKILEDRQIAAALPCGAFISSQHELWTRDRRQGDNEPTEGNWLPLRTWAGDTLADLVENGWEPQYVPRAGNPSGTFAVHLEKSGATPKVFLLLPAEIIPDWNRDGMIDDADRGRASAENPWRFWINDDDDEGDTGGNDIPQGEYANNTNSKNDKVDGLRDLVDFFPLFLDIKALLEALPPDRYRYRLTHPHPSDNPALRVVIAPQLIPEASGDYLKDLGTAQFYQGAETNPIHTTGPLLQSGIGQPAILDTLADGKGLLLIEGVRHTTEPIVLRIERKSDNAIVGEVPFHISIERVRSMFRHKNLRPYASSYDPPYPPAESSLYQPPNLPDALCNDDWLVFLHGYNVNETQAWGWYAEAFKRMFWSGNRAKFVSVSWHGDETQNVAGITPKYHKIVVNAMETAEHLSAFVNSLEGGRKYLAAHSLGCLVTACAMAREGMNAEMAFLIDPAIPTEALLPEDFISNDPHIEPASWREYPEAIKASDWHVLFPGTDERSTLAWRGLLHSAAPRLKIFFSEGEEVLAALPVHVPADPGLAANAPYGQYAFCIQAMLKGELGNEPYASQESFGGILASLLIKAFDSLSPATSHGGWRWTTGQVQPFYGIPNAEGGMHRTPPINIDDWLLDPEFLERLKTDPVFGITTPPGCAGLFHETDGHDVAADPANFRRILADMIPERTLPAGGAGGSGVEGSVLSLQEKFADAGAGEIKVFDMQEESNGWPNERTDMRWLHSDIREVAYTFTWPAWQKIVTTAELNREP